MTRWAAAAGISPLALTLLLFAWVVTYMVAPTHASVTCFQLGQDTCRCAAARLSNPPGEKEELSLSADKLSSRWEEIPGMTAGVMERRAGHTFN